MKKTNPKIRDVKRHLTLGISGNLLSALLLLLGEFLAGSHKLVAWLAAAGLWGVLQLLIGRIVRPRWAAVRSMWYYFLPTAGVLWFLEERRERQKLEKAVEDIQKRVPEAGIVSQIAHPAQRSVGLRLALKQMVNMTDQRLAPILDQIRSSAHEIARPESDDYQVVREIVGTIPSLNPAKYPMTWQYFLGVLADIFSSRSPNNFQAQVKKDMVTPLEEAIRNVDRAHVEGLETVVEHVMEDRNSRDDVARAVLKMILDAKCTPDVRQRIFDACRKRAAQHPTAFGYDFLHTLAQLGHKVFALDIDALRRVWAAPENYDGRGIVPSNKEVYRQLCATVFSPLEDADHPQLHHGRVYRRLVGGAGKASVECILLGGEECKCEGESLSFRGIYCRNCRRKPGEQLDSVRLKPHQESQSPFTLSGSVADLHTDQDGNAVRGRGIFFDGGQEADIQGLFDYICAMCPHQS